MDLASTTLDTQNDISEFEADFSEGLPKIQLSTSLGHPTVKFDRWKFLQDLELRTVGDLTLVSEAEVHTIRHFGPKRIRDVKHLLRRAGSTLRPVDVPYWDAAVKLHGSAGMIPAGLLMYEVEVLTKQPPFDCGRLLLRRALVELGTLNDIATRQTSLRSLTLLMSDGEPLLTNDECRDLTHIVHLLIERDKRRR